MSTGLPLTLSSTCSYSQSFKTLTLASPLTHSGRQLAVVATPHLHHYYLQSLWHPQPSSSGVVGVADGLSWKSRRMRIAAPTTGPPLLHLQAQPSTSGSTLVKKEELHEQRATAASARLPRTIRIECWLPTSLQKLLAPPSLPRPGWAAWFNTGGFVPSSLLITKENITNLPSKSFFPHSWSSLFLRHGIWKNEGVGHPGKPLFGGTSA